MPYIPWKLAPDSDPEQRWIVTTADGEDEVESDYLTEDQAIELAERLNREERDGAQANPT